jgi:hypothetical protein
MFQKEQAVKLDHLVPAVIAEGLQSEARLLLTEHGKRREMTLAATGGTPRSYTSVDRDIIYNHNGFIRQFFESKLMHQGRLTLGVLSLSIFQNGIKRPRANNLCRCFLRESYTACMFPQAVVT